VRKQVDRTGGKARVGLYLVGEDQKTPHTTLRKGGNCMRDEKRGGNPREKNRRNVPFWFR